jgi:tetratricopeptide (TPR) repeat protein
MKVKAICIVGVLLILCCAAYGGDGSQDMPITTSSKEALQLYLQGRTLLEMEKYQEAMPLFKKALAQDSSFALAYLGLAAASFSSQGASAYLKLLQKAIALQEQVSAPEKLCLQALDLTWQVKNQEAIALLQTILQQYPHDKRIIHSIAENYYGFQLLPDSALTYAKKALAIDAAFIPALNMLLSIYQEKGDFVEAEKAGLHLIELMPGEPGPLNKLAVTYRSHHKNSDALNCNHKALDLQADNRDALVGIANTHRAMEQYNTARKEYEQLVHSALTERDSTKYRNLIVLTYLEEGDPIKAIKQKEHIVKDIADASDHIYIANNSWTLAVLYLESEQWQKAKATYEQATHHYLLSDFTPEVKKLAELAQFGFAIEWAARQSDVQTAMGKIEQYMTMADKSAVNDYIQYGHELKGMIHYYSKEYDKAIEEFNRSDVKSAYVQYRLAQAYNGKGDRAKAKEHYLNVVNSKKMDFYYSLFRKKAKAAAEQL